MSALITNLIVLIQISFKGLSRWTHIWPVLAQWRPLRDFYILNNKKMQEHDFSIFLKMFHQEMKNKLFPFGTASINYYHPSNHMQTEISIFLFDAPFFCFNEEHCATFTLHDFSIFLKMFHQEIKKQAFPIWKLWFFSFWVSSNIT